MGQHLSMGCRFIGYICWSDGSLICDRGSFLNVYNTIDGFGGPTTLVVYIYCLHFGERKSMNYVIEQATYLLGFDCFKSAEPWLRLTT